MQRVLPPEVGVIHVAPAVVWWGGKEPHCNRHFPSLEQAEPQSRLPWVGGPHVFLHQTGQAGLRHGVKRLLQIELNDPKRPPQSLAILATFLNVKMSSVPCLRGDAHWRVLSGASVYAQRRSSNWAIALSTVLLRVMGRVSPHPVGWASLGRSTVSPFSTAAGSVPVYRASLSISRNLPSPTGCCLRMCSASCAIMSGPVHLLFFHLAETPDSSSWVKGIQGLCLHWRASLPLLCWKSASLAPPSAFAKICLKCASRAPCQSCVSASVATHASPWLLLLRFCCLYADQSCWLALSVSCCFHALCSR